ncbi:MAG: zinc ribbon domain-containing protein, partial [Ruminococcus sp.]|nr:zinc ribbon domain-containing protein [Ruminococcus sp.]
MGIKITSTTCPNCGANLPIEEGRNQMFCSYCGTSIAITNENEHIYRVVDEADVIHEETEQMVQLRRIELEEQRLQMEQQRMQSREKSKAKTTK